MPVRNPISNLLVPVSKFVACKRCGCENLAWAQFANGKWHLCEVLFERETAAGNIRRGPWANKGAIHNCQRYQDRMQPTLVAQEQKDQTVNMLCNAIMHLMWTGSEYKITDEGDTAAATLMSKAAIAVKGGNCRRRQDL